METGFTRNKNGTHHVDEHDGVLYRRHRLLAHGFRFQFGGVNAAYRKCTLYGRRGMGTLPSRLVTGRGSWQRRCYASGSLVLGGSGSCSGRCRHKCRHPGSSCSRWSYGHCRHHPYGVHGGTHREVHGFVHHEPLGQYVHLPACRRLDLGRGLGSKSWTLARPWERRRGLCGSGPVHDRWLCCPGWRARHWASDWQIQ